MNNLIKINKIRKAFKAHKLIINYFKGNLLQMSFKIMKILPRINMAAIIMRSLFQAQ